jgi:L,D-peptidoglycan transpeptidase YkuD (ErfK/YbiS/YcfS/YnhG family)
MPGSTVQMLTVRARPGARTRGTLRFDGFTIACALGRGGVRAIKREGDGATPIGSMRLLYAFYRSDRLPRPQTALPLRAIDDDLGWCDAVGDRNYNRPVRLPYPASHETMRRTDDLYDVVVVLDWNIVRRSQGRGSAIFLHIAKPGYRPTEGCIAVAKRDMLHILRRVGPGARIVVS